MRVIIFSALCTGILSCACAGPRPPELIHRCCGDTGAIPNAIDHDARPRAVAQYSDVLTDSSDPIVVDGQAGSIDPSRRIIVRSVGEAYAFFREHLVARGVSIDIREDGCLVISDSAELRQAVWAYAEAVDAWADVSAYNFANIYTPGFKRSSFRYRGEHRLSELPPHTWNGMTTWGVFPDWSSGTLDITSRPLDLFVDGEGLFQVGTTVDGHEVIAYTRSGHFVPNAKGQLLLAGSGGLPMHPAITIPDDESAITVARDGHVFVRRARMKELQVVGQIELARFPSPRQLRRFKSNLFLETEGSGTPQYGVPQSSDFGAVNQGMLEMSNVDRIFELIQLRLARDGRKLANEVLGTPYRTASAGSP